MPHQPMALTRLFAHRSGRVIALSRLLLALAFLAALWFDPSQPAAWPTGAYGMLGLYAAWSALLLLLTWSNWRRDSRLADAAHVVDVAGFGVLVFFTEGYTSPFFTFFVFLLLSSSIRWSWRETALTAFAIMILFVSAGTASLVYAGGGLEIERILVRFVYLLILSALFIWYGINQAEAKPVGAVPEASLERGGLPVGAIVKAAAARLKAPRIVFAWSQDDEPWLHVAILEDGAVRRERFAPNHFGTLIADDAAGRAFLFDHRRGVALRRRDDDPNRQVEFAQRLAPHFAEDFDLRKGLVVRIHAQECQGELFVLGTRGLCTDDLRTGDDLGQELSAMIDRSAALAFSEAAGVRRAKASLARDLHDGVVQSLAGAALRLQGIKAGIEAGEDVRAELDQLKADLAQERRNVRGFVDGLRDGRAPQRQVDLSSGLVYVAEELRQRWNLDCAIEEAPPVQGPVWMEHDVHQIIREAAANAVMHGGATRIDIAVAENAGEMELCIRDNGNGLVQPGDPATPAPAEADADPRSLRERAEGLGGTFAIESTVRGCRLTIVLPLV